MKQSNFTNLTQFPCDDGDDGVGVIFIRTLQKSGSFTGVHINCKCAFLVSLFRVFGKMYYDASNRMKIV